MSRNAIHEPPAARRPAAGWVALCLVVAVLAVYWPATRCEFINYDDPDYVTKNSDVQAGLTMSTVRWAMTANHASNWHPLTWLSHALDWQIYGDDPWGHHLTNVLFHAANTLLVFLVLRLMTGGVWRGALVAALFGLHPVHVESVAWVSERKDVLSAFFWLLTIGAYARYVREKEGGTKEGKSPFRAAAAYLSALVFLALGLMSKPMVVTLPFVLLLLDFWPLARWQTGAEGKDLSGWKQLFPLRRWGGLLQEKTPFFLLVAVSSALTFWAQKKGGAVTSLGVLSVDQRISNALIGYPRYLWKMIWPADLAVLYPHPWNWPVWQAALAGLFLLAATAGVVWQLRRRGYLAMGWFLFVGTLVPVIGLVQVGLQSIADRYTYIPLLGIFIIIAWGGAELFGKTPARRNAAAWLAALVIAACAVLTLNQLRLWKNSGTLFSHAVRVTKKNFLAHNNLGYYLYNNGREEEGMTHYVKALEIYPQFEVAWNNMGYALAQKGDHQNAIIHYRQAAKLKPENPDILNNLGNSLGYTGRDQEAMELYLKALKLNPKHADAHMNLGVALAQRGQMEEGVRHLEEAIRLNPKGASARSNYGNALAIQGKLDEAIEQYGVALRLNPRDAQAHNNLGNALSAKNRPDEAATHYLTALQLNANNPEAHCNLGFLLAKQGKIEAARTHLEAALRLRPDYPEARRLLSQFPPPPAKP